MSKDEDNDNEECDVDNLKDDDIATHPDNEAAESSDTSGQVIINSSNYRCLLLSVS